MCKAVTEKNVIFRQQGCTIYYEQYMYSPLTYTSYIHEWMDLHKLATVLDCLHIDTMVSTLNRQSFTIEDGRAVSDTAVVVR